MEIHILLAGEQLGPFSEKQVRQYLGEGLVTPTDLATYEGMEDWQPLDHVLAQLPPTPSAPETISSNEPPFIMPNDAPPTLELASAPPADAVPPITASRKTKRKPGKIVIQQILPLEATSSTRPIPKTGKTALTIEPPRPTTSLPPIAGFIPKERKSGKPLIRTGPVALTGLPGNPINPPATEPPVAPTATPPAPADELLFSPPPLKPPTTATEIPPAKARLRRIPRGIIYTCAGLGLLIVFLILAFLYFAAATNETVPAANPSQPESAAPAANPAAAQSPEAVPKTAAEYSTRGFAQQAKGDLDGALADYNQALDLDPKNLQALNRRGLVHQAKSDWKGAIADYDAVLSLAPRNADAFSSRGFVKQAQGDLDGAIADYTQALLINPKIPVVYYNMGLIEVQKGDLDGAIAAYSHALELDPKMAIAYYNRGVAKDAEGNLDGAIADYTQALVLNPKIARAYCDRGSARQSKGDSDGALADYDKTLALNPSMPGVYCNRGMIKMQKGDLDGAIVDSTRAIELDPKNGQAYCNRGMARLGKGNFDGAMADLKKFCELAPRDNDTDSARLYLWLIAKEENPKGNADEKLATSLQNDWNSTPEDFSSKIAAFLLGHSKESELIANAASPDPSREPGLYCKAWYFAGMKRLLAGDKATAISYFQKCLATDQKDYGEYIFARVELQALDPNRETPAPPKSNP